MKKQMSLGKDAMICGVCSGLAEYMKIDPSVMRLIWAFAMIFTGPVVVLIYFIFYWVLPYHDET